MEHLAGLNDAQRSAALHTEGPVLIIAGAGAGKTKTIAHRILHLVKGGVAPENILAITFTNKAAHEMKERIGGLVAREGKRMPFVSTFHTLGVHLLREFHEAAGVPKYFSILDKTDALGVLRRATKAAGYDPKQYPPEKTLALISRAKADVMGPNEAVIEDEDTAFPLRRIWKQYEEMLTAEKVLDFDDLILKTVLLLEGNETVRTQCINRWKFIHIDEYQDTNKAQYRLAKALAGEVCNICVVGDVDQSIFSWRGAHFRNLMRFEKDFPGTTVVRLEQNYRSTKNILAAADDIITKNKERPEKTLYTANNEGEKITVYEAADENEEARYVVETASKCISEGVRPDSIAVLYRANYQSRILEEAFLMAGLPYQLLGTRFFERKEVKDAISYLKAALNPGDNENFKRAIATPSRGIGEVTLQKIMNGEEGALNKGMQEKVAAFREILADINRAAHERTPSETIKFIMQRSGLETEFLANHEEERIENLQELVTLAAKYNQLGPEEGMEKLLTDASLMADQDALIDSAPAVRLMTVHASKGLEFSHVFVVGLEDGLFPHRRMGDSGDPEEERRLFYVAVTRAAKKLFLSWAQTRAIFGSREWHQPSPFIGDIRDEILDHQQGRAAWGFSPSGATKNRWSQETDDGEDTIQWGALGRR